MSEKEEARSKLVNAIACAVDDGEIVLLVEDAIAAAEERGRRAGIEEQRTLFLEVLRLLKLWPSTVLGREDAKELCVRIHAALAPRDSPLNAKVGRSDDGLPVVNFDRDALHEKAPRDSGKVKP